ncbi:DNA-binding transcriptional ArsR family regulator [Kibdelosporangium banguiense]|uniref:DNA-binding transcriptional ArsR family regulator n=1 Tax=Kibdelosporangium banguiense TaxID=1365924 RepID=A0ABS4TY54_9PSEU|nr:winged helix-turn-helix domain-containing protein [Kibdelosporangium banguiense]MBP2329302.1 DNA-binding transcriptional ArsR family regulator [Kibdelosporangium banguiense]
MLRICFTSDDIARTRIAPAPDPLWELVMSLHMLRPQPGDLLFRHWRRTIGPAIRQAGLGERLRLLLALTPTVGYFPDFLNPYAAIHGLEPGLEAVRSTPKTAIHHDLQHLAQSRPLPRGARLLATGDPRTLTELTDTMRTCYSLTITPYQRTIDSAVSQDRQIRTTALCTGGVEGLLASLRPVMYWNSGQLCLPTHPRDQEVHLDGRGLLLIPSYFCLTGPVTLFDPDLPPVLVYPVAKPPDALPIGQRPPGALSALIGATRAAILETLAAHPTTTTDLARRIGASAATASEHTTILRQAGLITSDRDRNRKLHSPTALGLALLNANDRT